MVTHEINIEYLVQNRSTTIRRFSDNKPIAEKPRFLLLCHTSYGRGFDCSEVIMKHSLKTEITLMNLEFILYSI